MPRNVLLAALAVVLLLALAGCVGSAADNDPSAVGVSPVADGAIQVALKDTMTFEPSTLTVHAGEPIVVLLTNKGAIPHNFTIEAAGVDVTLDPEKSDTVEFTAPTAPGEYEIVCAEAGHENAGMKGALIVER